VYHRLERARSILAGKGMDAVLSVAGTNGEILAVHAGPESRKAVARLAPEIRALGFLYVAIDLAAADPLRSGNT
jgi:hypothetical protein